MTQSTRATNVAPSAPRWRESFMNMPSETVTHDSVALFGRKINNAEHQLAFIEMLRAIVDGKVSPEEAVRAYHGILQSLGIKPQRSLDDDSQLTDTSMSYAAPATVTVRKPGCTTCGGAKPSAPAKPAVAAVADRGHKPVAAVSDRRNVGRLPEPASTSSTAGSGSRPTSQTWSTRSDGTPDFAKMTSEQRLAYHKARLNKKLGEGR